MGELARVEMSTEKFDKTIHGELDDLPVLPEGGDVAFFAKPLSTTDNHGAVVITFTVGLPDGTLARAQAVTTAKLFAMAGRIVQGWIDGGHL